MSPVRAVVFDIGGVLEVVDDDRWLDAWVARWESFSAVQPGTLRRSPSAGHSEAAFRARIQTALSLDARTLDRAITEFWDAYCGEADTELIAFARSLRPDVLVATLSNSGDGARREDDARYGFGSLFDLMVYSHEEGVEKPDPAIYRLTQERLGAQPHEIVFLDDREAAVEGARAVGWHALLHESTPASIAAIRALLAPPPQ